MIVRERLEEVRVFLDRGERIRKEEKDKVLGKVVRLRYIY